MGGRSCLGGVMVSMLAIRLKVQGFKPGQDGFLRVIKVCSMPSFGEEVYCATPNSSFPLPVTPACYQTTLLIGMPKSSGG
jgi:hypothetical protein